MAIKFFNSIEVDGEVQGTSLDINGNADISGNLTGLDNVTSDNYYINDTNTRLHEGAGNSVKITTNSGNLQIGPQNSSWCHMYTDRANFYFNTGLTVDGGLVQSYNEDLVLRRAGSNGHQLTIRENVAEFTGEVEASSLDINGNADISGNLTGVDNLTINGTLTGVSTATFAGDVQLLTSSGEYALYGAANAQTQLYHNGVKKLETTSSGIDVTGAVKGDSLDIDGNADISGALTLGTALAVAEGGTGATTLNALVQTSGDQSVAGNKTFTDNIVAGPDNIYFTPSDDDVYTPYTTNQWHSAAPFGDTWHDVQAFNRNYTTTQYVSTDGINFSSETLELGLFAQQDKSTYEVIGNGERAVRWKFYGVAYNVARYFQIASTYYSPAASCTVKIEISSDDSSWTEVHSSSGISFSASSRYYWVDPYIGNGGAQYVRVTIDKGDSGTKLVRLSSIKMLSQRLGDQGKGSEDAYPYTWDKNRNMTVGNDLTVSGGDITLSGTGRIQGVDTVSAGTDAANKTYVDTAISNLVDSAPGTLNTLNELAAALGDDVNFSTTVTNSIATKLPLAGGTMTGDLILGDNVKLEIGSASGGDLQLYHDGTHSWISDQGQGNLTVLASAFVVNNAADSENMIIASSDGSVNLYYDGSQKFRTVSSGAEVTGNLIFAGGSSIIDQGAIYIQDTAAGRVGWNRNTNTGAIHDSNYNAFQAQVSASGASGKFEIQAYNGAGSYGGSFFINGTAQPLINDYILHNGDDNTYFGFSGADTYVLATGGTTALTVNSSQAATFAGDIVTSSSSAVIQTPRISMEADGTLDWGANRDYGTLTWDTNKILIRALSGKAMEFETNGTTTALTLDTSQNATFAGTIDSSHITSLGTVKGQRLQAESSTFPQQYIIDSTSGGGDSRTMQLGMVGTSMYFKKSDATGAIYFRNTNNTNLLSIGLTDSGQVTVLNELEAGSLDVNGVADISGDLTLSNSNKIVLNGSMGTAGNFDGAKIRLNSSNTVDTTGFQGIRFSTSSADNYGWSFGANRSSSGRGSLRFYEHNNSNAGTERFTLLQDGNVGIGVSAPSAKLDVDGEVQATALDINGNADISGTLKINSVYTANADVNDLQIGSTTTGNGGLSIITGNTNTGGIFFGDNDNNDAGRIRYIHSSNSLLFDTNRTNALTIDSSQNATFAGEVEAASLDINGSGDISGDLVIHGKITQSGIVDFERYGRTYSVNVNAPLPILTHGGNALPTGGAYRVTGHISGTGTEQVSMAVFWNENGTWNINKTFEGGTSSNHVEFKLLDHGSGSVPTVTLETHTSNYNVHVYHERLSLEEGSGTDNLRGYFGADSYLSWLESNNTLTIPGDVNIGANYIGRDTDNLIDFSTDNQVTFKINNINQLVLNQSRLAPSTNDGSILGSASLGWSDLFLASGAVINFNNSDVTMTHSSNQLEVNGGNFVVQSNIECNDLDIGGTATGDGSGLTDLNGSQITTGTIAAARVATLNQNTTGNAGTVTNGVYTTGDQSIAGNKTFSGNTSFSGPISQSNTTQSTNNSTGAIKTLGGVGIAKTLNVGEDVVAYASSDKRYKNNLQAITNPIDKVKSLTGYTFTWNDKHEQFNGNNDIGVVAQEVERVFPEIVDTRDNGYKAVKYEKMVALLIEAVKDQQKQIDELKEMCNGRS